MLSGQETVRARVHQLTPFAGFTLLSWTLGPVRLQRPQLQNFQLRVKLVDAGAAGHNFERRYLLGRKLFEVHAQSAQRVAVRHDENILARPQLGGNFGLEEFHGPGLGLLEAFAVGRGHIVAAPPRVHLRLAVFKGNFGLVEALQVASHPLLQGVGVVHQEVAQASYPLLSSHSSWSSDF